MARLFDVWSARHESRQVDLAFVVDSTQSMDSYIVQTQSHIQNITRGVRRAAFDVRLALVGYRDHPPQDTSYVSKCHDFTTSVIEMQGL